MRLGVSIADKKRQILVKIIAFQRDSFCVSPCLRPLAHRLRASRSGSYNSRANRDSRLNFSSLELEKERMPIYEYACRKCGAHIEILQKLTDKPLTKCRKCGGKLEKQWSASGIQFKGSGWYVTDYAGRKSSDAKEEKKGAAEEKKSAASDAAATGEPAKDKRDKSAATKEKKPKAAAGSNASGD